MSFIATIEHSVSHHVHHRRLNVFDVDERSFAVKEMWYYNMCYSYCIIFHIADYYIPTHIFMPNTQSFDFVYCCRFLKDMTTMNKK